MSESTAWQPPVSDPSAARPSAPYSAGTALPGATGWTPPPKPGLIPLRPLTFGELLGATFQVLRRNPKPTFGFSLLVMGGVMLASLVAVGAATAFAVYRSFQAAPEDQDVIAAGSVLVIILASLVPAALSVVTAALVQGVVSLEVARGAIGEKHRLRGLWRAARGRLLPLTGWAVILFVAVLLAMLLLGLIIGGFALAGGAVGVAIAIMVVLVLGAGIAVLGAWLTTKLALVPSVLMVERSTLREAIARSWSLTTGYFWRTFGIILLVAVIVQVVGSIVTAPLSLLMSFGTFLIDPNGTELGGILFVVGTMLVTVIVSLVIGAIALVVQSATPALVYLDLRMRKEGLDLELQRFVESRQAGDPTIADPFARRSAAPAGGSAWG